MSRYELWLSEQAKMVSDGAAVATIVLEDPEGSVAGTWAIGFKDLASAVEGMLISLRESLPKGRYQFRLVAFDAGKNQLSFLPVVVVGASDAASDASRGRVDQERANALFIGNCEKMLGVQQRLIDSMAETQGQLLEAHAKTTGQLDELIELTRDEHTKILKAAAREERMGKLFEQFAPILQLGLTFAGEYGARWLAQKMNPEQASPAEPSKSQGSAQLASTPSAAAELTGLAEDKEGNSSSAQRPTASVESTVPSPSRVGSEPQELRANGERCPDGNGGRSDATAGSKDPAIHKRRKPGTKGKRQ